MIVKKGIASPRTLIGKISENKTHITGPTENWKAAMKLRIETSTSAAFI